MRIVGVDVGGTFTDVVLADLAAGTLAIEKLPTTPHDPSEAVVEGIARLVPPAELAEIRHGTTIATNTMLTASGARVGVVTTDGFRDILHLARHQRPQHYSIRQEIPWQDRPLAHRAHRKTVRERLVPPRGDVLVPLDEDDVRRAARELRDEGVEAVAVCFLFSYLDPVHEDRAAAIVREEHPQAFVTTSSSVYPQFREFERFTTAAANAYVGPPVRDYMERLASRAAEAGFGGRIHVMRSNGGVAPVAQAAREPVTLLLSGPAAGVLGGAHAGRASGREHLVTFDVGGTSADIGVVSGAGLAEASARDTFIGGFPIMAPMLDIETIGAGGGSIAYVDEGGAFRVGPRSAGARPGPAAYGHGGTDPTVTDAHVVLGRLVPERFLGGAMQLDVAAATTVIDDLAGRLGLSREDAAQGVLTLLDANMANAIRGMTVERGLDPRKYSLVAFGGAGPLHAIEVAALLEMREVIVPPFPGLSSALGLLASDLRYDAIATEFMVQGSIDEERVRRDLDRLEAGVRGQLREDGVPDADVVVQRAADLRYVGQGYELRVPVHPDRLDELWPTFHERHRREYGHDFPGNPIELVSVRATGIGRTPAPPEAPTGAGGGAQVAEREVVFGGERMRAAVVERARLAPGEVVEGPAIVVQTDTTLVVPPGYRAEADAAGNLLVPVGGRA
jgi:N-methylhydantoinase A